MNVYKALRRDNRKTKKTKKFRKGKEPCYKDIQKRKIRDEIKLKEKLEEELLRETTDE